MYPANQSHLEASKDYTVCFSARKKGDPGLKFLFAFKLNRLKLEISLLQFKCNYDRNRYFTIIIKPFNENN